MNENISLIADICGILGFLLSIYAVNGVIKIKKQNSSNNVKFKGGDVGGDFVGRDKN